MEKWPLPEGWVWKQVKSVLKTRSGNVDPRKFTNEVFALYSMPAYDEKMAPRIVPGSEIGSTKREVFSGDCLFSRLNPRIPRVWIAQEHQERAICSTDFVVWVDRKRDSDKLWFVPEYLRYMLLSPGFRLQVTDAVQGATGSRQRIRRTALQDAWIPIPPFETQHRIVARIEELFAELGAARRLHAALTHDAERLMDAAFDLKFSELAEDYSNIALGNIAHTKLGKMLSKAAKKGNSPAPYLRNANIQWDYIDLSDLYEMDFDRDDRIKYELLLGDLLVCEGGEIGRCAIWEGQLPDCYYQKALHRVRLKDPQANSRFLMYFIWWMSNNGTLVEHQTGSAIPHLTQTRLRDIRVVWPDFSVQDKIVAYLDDVQDHATALQRTADAIAADLDRLEQSILAQAFEGKL